MIRRGAPLTCPACEHEFDACWVDTKTGPQQCPSCGHEFEATWPGFKFDPVRVIVDARDGEHHAA
jgi:uncharacterized protein (UPF0212 family)